MIDLRAEFDSLLDIDKEYNWLLIRNFTENKCVCWRKQSDTPDPTCPNCEGRGWLFNERIEKCKLFNSTLFRPVAHLHDFYYGETYTQNFTIYLKATEKNRQIKMKDLLYDIECTRSGKIINPIRRIRKWEVMDVFDLRLDNNKSEFIKILGKPLTV